MPGFIKRQRLTIERIYASRGKAHTLSLLRFALRRDLAGLIEKHARGKALDVGSGLSPYKSALLERCESVTSVDAEDRSGEVDVVADVMDMSRIESDSFDTVLCTQVLEHVPRPWDAASELARVLKPGGRLILSVPHLSVIHEAPNDFFRYTRFGLESLLARGGLRVESVQAAGGLLSFLSHAPSVLLLSLAAPVPGLREVVWFLNYLLGVRMLGALDRLLGFSRLYPCNYVVLAVKEGGSGT